MNPSSKTKRRIAMFFSQIDDLVWQEEMISSTLESFLLRIGDDYKVELVDEGSISSKLSSLLQTLPAAVSCPSTTRHLGSL